MLKQLKRYKIELYVATVGVAALLATILLFDFPSKDQWTGMFLLSTLVALAGATPVRIPSIKTAVSATDPFVFTALAAYGPFAAIVVSAFGVLGASIGSGGDRRPIRVAFNTANVALSIAIGSFLYRAAGGVPMQNLPDQILPLLLATTAYFLSNTGLVTVAIVLTTRQSFVRTWSDSGLWTAVSAYAGLTLAAGLLYALEWVGVSGLALGIPPCWLLAAFYRTHKERQEEQQSRILQIEQLNEELEDKVAGRTSELQKALSHIERSNERLVTANERLIEANRAKSEFLANVSHELRTPLNAIIGFSDLLSDQGLGDLNDKQGEFVRDIHDSGEHLLGLINDILDLSKMEAGRMEVHREKIELAQAMRETSAMVTPQAGRKGLNLELDCACDVGEGNLDPGMFRQVLLNLMSNAVKFTPRDGTIRVVARRRGTDLIVRVEDTGIGVPEEHQQRIFDEFHQVDGSYARNYGGTGLGLALVRRMVSMQGGSVSVESEVGKGSSFICEYPECLLEPKAGAAEASTTIEALATRKTASPRDSVAEETVPVSAPPAAAAEHRTPSVPGQRQTILVVEDNEMNRKLARNVLRSRGFEVLEATTGEQALEYLAGHEADLVLMDIQLPGMDGLEVTRRLKADPQTAHLPIVALTAHTKGTSEQEARDAGCVGYISKPIRLSQFPGQVQAYLEECSSVV